MTAYLWFTATVAVVLTGAGFAVWASLPKHFSDGDYGRAMIGVILVAAAAILAVAHGVGWLVKMW